MIHKIAENDSFYHHFLDFSSDGGVLDGWEAKSTRIRCQVSKKLKPSRNGSHPEFAEGFKQTMKNNLDLFEPPSFLSSKLNRMAFLQGHTENWNYIW